MGKIIAIANQKGGVGKTTLAVHLAVGAVQCGQRVALLDADPQGNTTSWALDGEMEDGFFRLLVVGDSPLRVMRPIRRWGLGLLPGNYRTGEALAMLAAVGRLAEVPQRIAQVGEIPDLLIVDMPPSRNAGFTEILSACDWVICPTQLERLSLEGVGLMAQTAQQLRNNGGGPRLMGVVPNMTRSRTTEHREQMDGLVKAFGRAVWPPLPLTVRVAEAVSQGLTLFEASPDEPITGALLEIVMRMLEVLQ